MLMNMTQDHKDPTVLYQLYWEQGLSTNEIGDKFGVDGGTIVYHMEGHGIPRRTEMREGFWKHLDPEDSIFEFEDYLMPTQRADLKALVGGQSLSERAKERGVHRNTVRTNARNAYERLLELKKELE